MAAHGVIYVEHRPHAVRQLVAPLLTAPTGNAVGKATCQQGWDQIAIFPALPTVQPLKQLTAAPLPVRLAAGEGHPEIDTAAARRLLQNSSKLRRRGRLVSGLGTHQHSREARRYAQPRHLLTARRQLPVFQRPELHQQGLCRRQVHRWRHVQPAELGRIATAPLHQLQQHGAEIALQDLRLALGRCPLRLLFRQQVQADARLQPSGTPGTLGH